MDINSAGKKVLLATLNENYHISVDDTSSLMNAISKKDTMQIFADTVN